MRRRIKLFSAIASLCVAIGLMAFGVYAATTVNYTVNGSVTYEVADVYADITTTVYTADDTKRSFEDTDALTSYVQPEGEDANVPTWTQVQKLTVNTYDTATFTPSGETLSSTLDELDFNKSTLYLIEVRIVSQDRDTTGSISINLATIGGTVQNGATNVTFGENPTETTVVTGDEGTVLNFYVAVKDVKQAATGDFVINVELEKVSV